MRLLQITTMLFVGLCLCLCIGSAKAGRQGREANAAPEPEPLAQPQPQPEAQPDKQLGVKDSSTAGDKFVSDATTTIKPLGIVSIKSRAIDMSRGLCQEQSRYHPHYPKCHQYCKKLDHWIGQCWRKICHCYS